MSFYGFFLIRVVVYMINHLLTPHYGTPVQDSMCNTHLYTQRKCIEQNENKHDVFKLRGVDDPPEL